MSELFLTFKPVVHGYDNLQAVIDGEVVGRVVSVRDYKVIWQVMTCGARLGLLDLSDSAHAAY